MNIVCFFQTLSNYADYFSEETAVIDATAAINVANALKMPEKAAIYFAVDYDALEANIQNNIIPYFRKIANVFSQNNVKYRIGVYGSGKVCKAVKDTNNIAELSFLCGSLGYQGTSSYNSITRFDVRQNAPQILYEGVYIDYDETWQSDFGQW